MSMGRSKQFVSALLVGLLLVLPFSSLADTQWITISAVVPNLAPPVAPIVHLSGYAAPGASVTITRDSTLISTLVSGGNATFSVILSNEPVGQHEYVLSATDTTGEILGSQTLALNLQPGSTSIISGLFLGPSINLDKTTAEIGENVTISGQTAPDSAVTVTIFSSQVVNLNVSSNANGTWSKVVNTQSIGTGQHSIKARSINIDNTISGYSRTVALQVNPFDLASHAQPSDINMDGFTNLVDLSILLFFWRQANPSNPRADVNRSGFVDIVDFSILLFQWTD